MTQYATALRAGTSAIEVNRVLKNTYFLLAFCVAFSAVCAFVSMPLGVSIHPIVFLVGIFGISWIVNRTAHTSWGILWTFVYVGFLGVATGPILQMYLAINPMLVVQALGLTAASFVGLSMYTIVKRADFSWLGQFLTISVFVILGTFVLSFFVDLSPLSLLLSGFMVFVAAALIAWQTSRIVLGGETNYIIAANTLFVSIWILFMNLLSILGIFSGDE